MSGLVEIGHLPRRALAHAGRRSRATLGCNSSLWISSRTSSDSRDSRQSDRRSRAVSRPVDPGFRLVTLLLIVAGAAIGAPLRYFTDRVIQARHDSVFPWGTLPVNVVGSLVFGILVGGAQVGGLPAEMITFAGTGFCGALTTYSTFGYETARLAGKGSVLYAALNAIITVSAGLGVAFLGVAIGTAVWA